MNDFISIIIPAYNLENYIENTVHNVLSQEYGNFEIVIVNDGSRDKTGEILDRLAALHPDKLCIIHIPNGGVTNARLTGVLAAKGDWIGFVDGDDLLEPNMYAILLENALKHNADISHCGYNLVFPSRTVPYHGTDALFIHNRDEALIQLLTNTMIETGLCNKLYKKSLLISLMEHSVMDSSIRFNEDLLMNFYLFRYSGKSVYYDRCLYNYMVRAGSATNSTLKEHHLSDPLKVRRRIMEHSQNLPSVYPIACEIYMRQLSTLSTYSDKENPSLIRPLRKEALKELRFALRQKLPLSLKSRLLSSWAATSPTSYRFVHSVYAKLKGYDKIYEIK